MTEGLPLAENPQPGSSPENLSPEEGHSLELQRRWEENKMMLLEGSPEAFTKWDLLVGEHLASFQKQYPFYDEYRLYHVLAGSTPAKPLRKIDTLDGDLEKIIWTILNSIGDKKAE